MLHFSNNHQKQKHFRFSHVKNWRKSIVMCVHILVVALVSSISRVIGGLFMSFYQSCHQWIYEHSYLSVIPTFVWVMVIDTSVRLALQTTKFQHPAVASMDGSSGCSVRSSSCFFHLNFLNKSRSQCLELVQSCPCAVVFWYSYSQDVTSV